ncbi:MAG: HAMP domain-containing histidine kinase, partial [bacterium]|nr:HAMP domain-containing histidine kinase [bacterium]
MPTSDYKYPVEFLVSDPASQVLSALESWSAKADLQFLSQSSVQALQEEPGVSRVVLALNSETISLLDSRCLLDGKSLLGVTSDADEGRWRDCDFSWPEDLSGSQLQWGEGKYPGSNVWPEEFQNSSPSESKQCWVRILVMAREIPAMMIVISCKESLQEQPLWGQNMTRLQQVLQMTCNQWLESVALDLQVRNLSDEKQALSRLNRLQGRFVSMASHEFKTPLTSITAYADALLGQKDKQTPVTTEFLGVIRSEAGRLLRMVNRILDFSRMEYGSRLLGGEPKKLIPLIEETLLALKPTMAAKQLDCTLVDKQQIPRVIVDTDLIRQVLVNLIGNAVKFTPEGGCISINLVEVESSVEVQISDNGPGIPQRDIHRIFREFFRSRETASQEEGTGLGLTIVRHIINLHGGYVKARQRIGGGSVFTFGVPKEIHVLGTLPQRYTDRMEVTEAQRMMTAALQLVAETAKVKKVSLLLNDSHGNPRPVLALGLNTNSATSLPQGTFSSWEKIRNPELSAERADLDWSWHPDGEPEKDQTLIVPLWGKNEKQGYLILENPTSGEGFESSAKVQAMILARVTVMALRVLYERSGQT